jgi:hypothetical protein
VDGELDLAVRGFRARQSISLRTDELESFRDELRALDAERTGKAVLTHLEEELGLTVQLKDGKGTLSGFVLEHVGPELRFDDIEIDQSFVKGMLSELDALVQAFPVRGGAGG